MTYSKTPLIRISGDHFNRFELEGFELERIRFYYFKPLRNGQLIRIKREFELSGLRNRGVLLYYIVACSYCTPKSHTNSFLMR